MKNTRILIVPDGGAEARRLEQCLKGLGYTVCSVAFPDRKASGAGAGPSADLALIDLDMAGLEAAERIGRRFDIPLVCLTDGAAPGPFPAAFTDRLFGCVLKPFDERQLNWSIQTALSLREADSRLRSENDELRRRIALMETVFESMEEGVIAVDENAEPLLFNGGAARIGGVRDPEPDVDQWAPMHGIYRLDKETLLPVEENPLVLAMRGQPTDGVEVFVRNEVQGDGAFVSVNGRPLKDYAGKRGGGVVVFQDITRRKEAEIHREETVRDLREQSELLQAVFDSVGEGLVVSDDSGEFLYINPAARAMLGQELARRRGRWPDKTPNSYYDTDRVTPIDNEDLPLPRAIFRGESTDDRHIFVRRADHRGGGIFVRTSARPLRDDARGIRGGILVFRDVTSQMLAEEAVTLAFAQGRLEVVETILHDIGNAINSVTVGIDTLHQSISEDRLAPRLRALADAVNAHRDDWPGYIRDHRQGRNVLPLLIALADDYVRQTGRVKQTVSRVRHRARHIADIVRTQKALGNAKLTRKDVNLRQCIDGAVNLVVESLDRKIDCIRVDCAGAPASIRIQESPFHQMLVNLIKNSLEAIDELSRSHGLEEPPSVRVRAYADAEFLNIEVRDNGIGFQPREAKGLFAAGHTTKDDGTGLGLHSAANFVIGSGGQIEIASDGVAKGAAARVRLRLSSVTPTGASAPPGDKDIVDDDVRP